MSTQSQRSDEDRKARKAYEKPKIERVNLQVREVMLGACYTTTSPAATPGQCQMSGCSG